MPPCLWPVPPCCFEAGYGPEPWSQARLRGRASPRAPPWLRHCLLVANLWIILSTFTLMSLWTFNSASPNSLSSPMVDLSQLFNRLSAEKLLSAYCVDHGYYFIVVGGGHLIKRTMRIGNYIPRNFILFACFVHLLFLFFSLFFFSSLFPFFYFFPAFWGISPLPPPLRSATGSDGALCFYHIILY